MNDDHASPLNVLIAENHRVVSRELRMILEGGGFNVSGEPRDPGEVFDLVRECKPDLVLLSVRFGDDFGGIELARKLRQDWSVPVVFVTGAAEEKVFRLARAARPLGFVRKPFCGAEILACMAAAAQRIHPFAALDERVPEIRRVADTLEAAVIASGVDGRVVLMNGPAERLTGWEESEAAGMLCHEVTGLQYGAGQPDAGAPGSGDGGRRSLDAVTQPVRDDEGELLGTLSILRMNSGEGHPEDSGAIAAAMERFSSLTGERGPVEADAASPRENEAPGRGEPETEGGDDAAKVLNQLGDPLLVLDRDGLVVQANVEASMCFAEGDALIGRAFWDLFSPDEFHRFEPEFMRPFRDGKRHRFEFHDSVRTLWYEVRLYRSHDGVIALFHDVTEKRITKAEEIRQHRLEGLGLLARGFVHDFNNHLTTVTGNLGLAKERERSNPELLDMLNEAEAATTRAAGLVQQLMTFATGGRPIREPVKAADLLRQVLSERRTIRPDIRYQFECGENELRANVDRAQVRRVIENLISNAEESMPDGGALTARCSRIDSAKVSLLKEDFVPRDEDHLLIQVTDNGRGMSEEVLAQALHPYFSTRPDANASGIGLTVCDSIAGAHSGFVHLQSAEGSGTTATFCVPLGMRANLVEWEDLDSEARTGQTGSGATGGQADLDPGNFRILILEDDGPIRRLLGATLRRAGFEVVETAEGGETIESFQAARDEGSPFDLLISDLTIENGMGGLEAMRRLLEIDPDLVAIVSSGYSDEPAMSNPGAFGFKGVIPKPYSPQELERTVRSVISAHCAKAASSLG